MGRTYRKRKAQTQEQTRVPNTSVGSLLRFCIQNSLSVGLDRLRPYNFTDSGRGLQALKAISPGQLLIQIPQPLLITTSTTLRNPVISKKLESVNPSVKFPAMALLAAHLLIEESRGEMSPIVSYLRSLPSSFTNLICMEKRIHSLVLDEQLASTVKTMHFTVERDYELTLKLIGSISPLPDFDKFLWTWLAINSRSVFMEQPKLCRVSGEDNMALAPFLDLFNHTHTARVTAGFNPVTNCYEIVTHDRYKKYDQVFINYGSHCNRMLLLDYGFTLKNNSNDVILVFARDLLDALKSIIPASPLIDATKMAEVLDGESLDSGLLFDSDGASWNLIQAIHLLTSSKFSPTGLVDEVLRHQLLYTLIQTKISDLRRYQQSVHLALNDTSLMETTYLTLSMLQNIYADELGVLENAKRVWGSSGSQ